MASESDHQMALFTWAHHASGKMPDLRKLYAVPNGGARSKGVAGRLKAEGVKAGRPDIGLDVARKGYHGLRIELKVPAQGEKAKGSTSKEQRACIADLTADGYLAVVSYGWDEARQVITEYLS